MQLGSYFPKKAVLAEQPSASPALSHPGDRSIWGKTHKHLVAWDPMSTGLLKLGARVFPQALMAEN